MQLINTMLKDYNSTRGPLYMPEYGRNIQRMVAHACTIEDREERNRCARTIIEVMGNLFPELRDTEDSRHKLWDHLAIMSNFQLDIDSPYPMPTPEKIMRKPDRLDYNFHRIRFRHFGSIIERMANATVSMPDLYEQQTAIQSIACSMKRRILMLNKDDISTDDRIFDDLRAMTDGAIYIDEGVTTSNFRPNLTAPDNNNGAGSRKQQQQRQQQGGGKKNRNQRRNRY